MKQSKLLKAVVAGIIATATITGCSSVEHNSTNESNAASKSESRPIKHAMGETAVHDPIKRVVTLDRGLMDPAIALGLQVVGYTDISGSKGIPEYFGKDGSVAGSDAKSVGSLSEPNLEKISELAPDAIFSAKVRHEEIYPQLSKIAPTIFAAKTGETWKDNLLLVGETVGEKEKAQQLVSNYESRAKRIGDRIRAKEGKNPTVTVVRFVDDPTRIYKDDTYIGVIMKDLGFARNAASSGTGFNTEISEEEISKMDGDHIFIATYGDDEGLSKRHKEEFERNPLWSKLKGAIHEVNDTTWMSAVGLYGANSVLDDVAKTFGVSAE